MFSDFFLCCIPIKKKERRESSMVDPSELEQCVRAACTWSRAEFKDYLNSTNLAKREKKMEMQEIQNV